MNNPVVAGAVAAAALGAGVLLLLLREDVGSAQQATAPKLASTQSPGSAGASSAGTPAPAPAAGLVTVPVEGLYAALEKLQDDGSLTQRQKFEAVWSAYKARRGNRQEARLLLDYLGPLVSTEESRLLLNEVLSPSTADHDKSQMLTALMHLNDSLPSTLGGESPMVISAAELQDAARRHLGSSDPFLATSSLFVVSRLGNDGARAESAIISLHSRGVLNEDAYAREMLMQIRAFRDAGEQAAFSKRLVSWSQSSGEAKAALSKMAPGLIDQAVAQSMSPDAKAVWRTFLEGAVPELRGQAGALDLMGSAVYVHWLHARAALDGVPQAGIAEYLLAQASSSPDPAATLAVMLSPYGQDVARAAAARGQLGGLETLLKTGRKSARPSDQPAWNNGLAVVRSASQK